MPVRSLTQSLLRWPHPEQVQALGLLGSDGRGAPEEGSDLDLLLIDATAVGPQHQRIRHGPLDNLPFSCDALALTSAEFEQLMASGSRMAQELRRNLRWLGLQPASAA